MVKFNFWSGNLVLKVSIILAVVLLLVPLVSAQTTVTILRPGTPEKVKSFLEPAIEEFEKKYPDIKVDPMYLDWTSWISKAPTMWGANEQPDVILWWNFRQSEEYAKPRLVPLEKYVDSELIEKNMYADRARIDGELYLFPASVGPITLYWRRDVFEEAGLDPQRPPQTFEELFNYLETIKNNTDVYPMGVPAKLHETIVEFMSAFYYPLAGKEWLDEKNKPTFNTKECIQALTYFKDLGPYAYPGAVEYAREDYRSLLRDRKIAMYYEGPWPVPLFQESFGENLDESPIGIGLTPGVGEGKPGVTGFDGWVITHEERAEAAGKLISFIASPEQQFRHDIIYGLAPVYLEELEKEPFNRFDFWKVFVEGGRNSLPRPGKYHPRPYAVTDILMEMGQKIWLGVSTPEKAIEEAVNKIDSLNKGLGIEY